MIRYINDLKEEMEMTEKEFREEAKVCIDFAVNGKEYNITEIDSNFIAEEIAGIMNEHKVDMPKHAMEIISEELEKFKNEVEKNENY